MKYKIGLQTLTLIHSDFFPSAFPTPAAAAAAASRFRGRHGSRARGGVRVRRRRAAEPATAALARPHDSSAQGCRVPQEQVRGWAGERGCVAFDGDGPYTGVSDGRVARLLPITLGQVFQRIDVVSKDFGNIVDVELGGPWLLLPVEVMATLAHKFGIIGEVGFCVQC
uniref:Uncharacterized protein n=1 Tax=Oryza nivara TaxID=4536 RepID=A0A0E0HC96_ORYNI